MRKAPPAHVQSATHEPGRELGNSAQRCAQSDSIALRALLDLYAIRDLRDFPQVCLRAIGRVLPSSFLTYAEARGLTRRQTLYQPEEHAQLAQQLMAGLLAASTEERASAARVRQLKRQLGLADAAVLTVQRSACSTIVIALGRIDSSFSEPERAVLALLQQHLRRAHEIVSSSEERRHSIDCDANVATALLQRQFSLTRRESELLYWLARGKSNREMGTIFGISARTVDKHLQHVFDKLDVENRHAAMVQALEAMGSR